MRRGVGCAIDAPPEPCARPGLACRMSPRGRPHSFDVGPHLIGPAGGSAYSVPRSPSAVRLPWGLPADGGPCASAWGADHVLDPSLEFLVPDSPPASEDAGTALMEFCPLRHTPARRIRSLPGVPRPGTFRPQGLATLSTAFAPPHPAAARRPPRHPWGCPFRALLLPASGTPLGASPLLSFLRAASAARPRLQRMTLTGKGTDEPPRKRGGRRSLPSWVSPLQGSLLWRLGPASRPEPFFPFRPEVLFTVPLPAGDPRVVVRQSRLASLETAGPPGVLHLPETQRLLDRPPPRAHGFASTR